MFSFRETNFRLVELFDWEYARMQFLLSVSRNRYSFALAGYRNEKSATDPALNLTVVFNSKFNFSNHVSQVIKSTRVQARDLYRIRPLLDPNTSVLLANALVSSRLDYCNSLFLSLTDIELRRLQLV